MHACRQSFANRHTPPRRVLWLLPCLLACVPGCRRSETESTSVASWRFAIEESPGSVQHAYATRFKRLIEERSGGRVEVTVYPYGALGTATHTIEQLNLGVLQFAMASPGSLGKFIPETQAFLLHFVLDEDERVNRRALRSPRLLEALDARYREKGLRLLSLFSEGEMAWTTRRLIRRPDDFRGVRMRVMTSPILFAAYAAYGASPIPLPYAETYSALQLRMVDGQVNPVFAIERQKFYEVTDWLIFPGHAHFVTSLAANKQFFDSLSPSDRQMVRDVTEELDAYIFELQQAFANERLADILRACGRRGKTLHLCGDLDGFLASLSAAERRELVQDNPLWSDEPPLTDEERARFRAASRKARTAYLQIGGTHAPEVLELLADEVSRARTAEALDPHPGE